MTSHANTDSTASSSSSSSTHVRKSRSKTTTSSSPSPSSSTTTTTTTTTTTMVPQETPHMNVLGMDGTDLDLDLDLGLDIRKPPHTNMSTTHGKSAAAAAAAADTGTGTAHFRSENAAMAASTAEEASPILPHASRGCNSSTSTSTSTSTPPSSPRRTTSRRRQYRAGTNSSLSTELVPNHRDGDGHRKSNWLGNLLWNKNSGNSGGDGSGSGSGSCAANLNVDGEQAHHDHHHDDDDDEASTHYQSLEAPTAGSHDDGNRDGNEDAPSSYHHHPSRPTVEDQLKQDCHFFYQGMTTSTSTSTTERDGNSNGGGLLRQRLSTRAFLHHSIPQLLSSAEGARFQAKYQRLNQDLRQTFGSGNGGGGDGGGGGGGIHSIVENDLYLDEYSTTNGGGGGDDGRDVEEGMDFQAMTGPISASSLSATQQLSTLIYEQNGKLLMKLPRDQMRLIMDQELEPGILSVEQWRDKSDATSANTITHHSHQYVEQNHEEGGVVILEDTGPDNRSSSNTKQQQHPPPLQYVMTVPDDLYRRVVSEMSNSLAPPCWGFFKCCSDTDGRADIKLALGILCVTFLLMFISTMEWPTE